MNKPQMPFKEAHDFISCCEVGNAWHDGDESGVSWRHNGRIAALAYFGPDKMEVHFEETEKYAATTFMGCEAAALEGLGLTTRDQDPGPSRLAARILHL